MRWFNSGPAGIVFLAAAIVGPGISGCHESPAADSPESGGPSQLIVKMRDLRTQDSELDTATVRGLGRVAGIALAYYRRMGGAHVLRLPAGSGLADAESAAARLTLDPSVAYAVADYIRAATAVPDDPLFSQQWHYLDPASAPGGANLPEAWDLTTGDAQIVVAVIDSGVLDHPDLRSKLLPGYDFIGIEANAADGDGRDPDPSDPGDGRPARFCGQDDPGQPSSWHGTHVAGTVAAATGNSLGVAGTSWASPVVPARVLGKCGGLDSDIVDAIYWSAGFTVPGVPDNGNPARVLNLSLGGPGQCGPAYQEAINAVTGTDVVVVAAAGNAGENANGFAPANCSGVITVHAHSLRGQHAPYSNFGTTVEISGPGGDMTRDPAVLSTHDGGRTEPAHDGSYGYLEGTSMAAPHLSGIAALMLARNPNLAPSTILGLLQQTARPFPDYGEALDCDTARCGAGMVDAGAAVSAVPTGPVPPLP